MWPRRKAKQSELEKSAQNVIKHLRRYHPLRRVRIYGPESNLCYHPGGKRIFVNREKKDCETFDERDLGTVINDAHIRSIAFYDLGDDNTDAISVASRWGMIWRRFIGEFIAKNSPSPTLKNRLYQLTGVKFDDPKTVTIAPNVTMEYINPNLVHIGNGTTVGEDVHIWSHILEAGRFVIGHTEIGQNCTVGVRSVIWPGAVIGAGAKIESPCTIAGVVEPGQVVTAYSKIGYQKTSPSP